MSASSSSYELSVSFLVRFFGLLHSASNAAFTGVSVNIWLFPFSASQYSFSDFAYQTDVHRVDCAREACPSILTMRCNAYQSLKCCMAFIGREQCYKQSIDQCDNLPPCPICYTHSLWQIMLITTYVPLTATQHGDYCSFSTVPDGRPMKIGLPHMQ